jgi:hypothetical protein
MERFGSILAVLRDGEMPGLVEKGEVAELLERDHGRSL